MAKERKEPGLGRLEAAADSDRIPTLTDIAAPDAPPGEEQPQDAGAESTAARDEPPKPLVQDPWAKPGKPDERQLPLSQAASEGVDAADYDFIEELTRAHDQPAPPAQSEAGPEPEPEPEPLPAPDEEPPAESEPAPAAPAAITAEELDALADRVLDQLAPVLREAVAAAVADLLARRRTRE